MSSGKTAILRELKISHTEQAAQLVASKAKGNPDILQLLMQKALVGLLLVQVNDKDLSAAEKEDMDSLFTMSEYSQILYAIKKMSGGDDEGNDPRLEMITT